MIDLPDVNLWVTLVDQRHVHHSLAQAYWSENGVKQFGFCRLTMLGFLRVSTSPQATVDPKTFVSAWSIYQEFRALPNIQFLAEPIQLETAFQTLTTQRALPHRLWSDAYLAAFAIAGGHRLVSFDSGFARFPGLNFLHLKP